MAKKQSRRTPAQKALVDEIPLRVILVSIVACAAIMALSLVPGAFELFCAW